MLKPAGAESLARLLVERVRFFERNCRCPRCHGLDVPGPVPRLREHPPRDLGPLACIDCEFCVANLRKLMLGELTNPAAAFFPCVAERIGGTLVAMNKNSGKKAKAKAQAKRKVKAKTAKKKPAAKVHSPVARKGVGSVRAPKPVSIAAGRRTGGDSDRGLYVRFENPTVKALVEAQAKKTGVSMNAYIVAATLDWLEKGKELPNPKDAAAAERVAATG